MTPAVTRALEVWYETYEERAAILEFDAGLERGVAEARALELTGPPPAAGASA